MIVDKSHVSACMGLHSSASAVKKARTARNKSKKAQEGFHLPIIPELEDEAIEINPPADTVDQGNKQGNNDYEPDEDPYEEDMVVDDVSKKKGKANGFVVSDGEYSTPIPEGVTLTTYFAYYSQMLPSTYLKVIVQPSSESEWEKVLEIHYNNIGCDQVHGKPQTLQWKMSDKSKNKARSMSLESEMHWANLKFEVEREEIKKKGQVTVYVSLPEGYLDALRMRLIPNYKPETKKGKANWTPINLDIPCRLGAGPSDSLVGPNPNALAQPHLEVGPVAGPSNNRPIEPFSGDSGPAHPPGFQDTFTSIIQYLKSCTSCPHKDMFCARTNNKAHVQFTSVLVKAWAHVLACKATSVMFDKPLDTPLFTFYYNAVPGATVQPPSDNAPSKVTQNTGAAAMAPMTQTTPFPSATVVPDLGNMLLVCLGQMQMQMFRNLQQEPSGSLGLPSQMAGTVTGRPIASYNLSDVIVDENNEYPSIDTFFEELKLKYPQHNFSILLQRLTDSRMRTIDEFTLWSEDELVGTFRLSAGEAQWVLKQVKIALKTVLKA
ncbi:hypothetical protein K439DRAFT_1618930 [Ramaria rubella]|nr:hypothetical protein K439DRAFT_1618930 [Ramaria rubella]